MRLPCPRSGLALTPQRGMVHLRPPACLMHFFSTPHTVLAKERKGTLRNNYHISAVVTLSTWTKVQWLLPLSRSRCSEYLLRSSYSLSPVVGREKRGTSASIHAACFL